MTNKETLETLAVLDSIEKIYFEKETKAVIPLKVFYGVQKNIRIFGKVRKSKEEIDKDIMASFKKEFEFDEKNQDKDYLKRADDSYKEFVKKEEVVDTYNEFFDAESDLTHYKIDKELLEEAVLPSFVLEVLEKLS